MIETAYIGGTFDLFHYGHLRLLQRARERFGRVVVALNTDEFNLQYKGVLPVNSLAKRFSIMLALKCVDSVVVNTGGADSKLAILTVKPDVIVTGNDWTEETLVKQMQLTPEFIQENSLRFYQFPYTQGISTTSIIEQCQKLKS